MRTNSDPSGTGQVSLIQFAAAVLRHWRLIVVLPVVLAVTAAAVTLSMDRKYRATASLVPQAAEARAPSGAAALAQQFGVNLGERTADSPDFYVDLLQSRALLRAAVETEYTVPGRGTGTLIQFYGVPEDFGPSAWRRAMLLLRRNLSTSASPTGVVRLSVSAETPLLAEQIATRLLDLLNEFNAEVRQSRAQEEGRFVSGRVEQAGDELLAAELRLQQFLSRNRSFQHSPDLLFEHDRLQRQVAIRQEVYTSLLRALEQNRIDSLRDTPVVTVIDHPAGSAEPQPRGTVTRALLAFTAGILIAMLVALTIEFLRRRRETDPEYRELQGAARTAWSDIRRPRRWLRQAAESGAER